MTFCSASSTESDCNINEMTTGFNNTMDISKSVGNCHSSVMFGADGMSHQSRTFNRSSFVYPWHLVAMVSVSL